MYGNSWPAFYNATTCFAHRLPLCVNMRHTEISALIGI
jgi:hypothetical protein